MAITKSAKIEAEIEKVKAKIAEQQARLKELEQKKLEAENSEIVEIVRGMSISLADLPLVLQQLRGGASGHSGQKPTRTGGGDGMKKLRLLLITLCVSVLMGSMAVTAYAGGGEEWDGLDPVEPPPVETVDPGEGFTEDGNLVTRDLLYDKATNKQFITVQTSGGNTFYIVIDYDKPTDEDGEQYQTYFSEHGGRGRPAGGDTGGGR